MSLISVIMPVYMVEDYLQQCIDSVVNQDLEDIEIIPVDNGASDICKEIIAEFEKKDVRVKPIHFEENQGYGKAINAGFEKATGKYIAIVETDDYIEKDMLSSLYKIAEEYDANVVKAGFKKLYSDGTSVIVLPPLSFYKPVLKINPKEYNSLMFMESSIWAALYKREFLQKNNITMLETKGASYQDSVFKFIVYASTDFVVCVNKSVYNYRVMTANSSSKSTKNWDAMFKNYSVIKDWMISHNKFEDFKSSYFLHGYFDFVFHFKRLSNDTKSLFLKKAKEFYKEGISNGVGKDNVRFSFGETRGYYQSEILPFLEMLETRELKNDREIKNRFVAEAYPRTKKIIRRFYYTKVGKRLWEKFSSFVHMPFFWDKLNENSMGVTIQTANILQTMDVPNNMIELDPSGEKNVLVLLPWYELDAVIYNVENICAQIKNNGYRLHIFLYWSGYAPENVNRKIWDRVFYKHCDNPYFARTNSNSNNLDADHIDEWVDDDFLQSIIRLNNHYKYDICIANYIFYSKAFTVLSKNVRKVLYTHDKFFKRNTSLNKAGFLDSALFFSVATEEEEAKALLRSDLVLAIQEDDANYFRRITKNNVQVETYPFIPKKNTISKFPEYKELTVGYIASSNPPNYFSLLKIAKNLENSNVRLFVAGTICNRLKKGDLGKNCTVLGIIDSLEDFYSSYDLYINADTFYSGFKCKTIEAMSYGVGIICTKISGTGLDLSAEYHNFFDEKACCDYLKEISNYDPNKLKTLLGDMRKESEKCYKAFIKKYPINELTKKIISK